MMLIRKEFEEFKEWQEFKERESRARIQESGGLHQTRPGISGTPLVSR
jgi:hypothetical protein